jgi:hypothetical protein
MICVIQFAMKNQPTVQVRSRLRGMTPSCRRKLSSTLIVGHHSQTTTHGECDRGQLPLSKTPKVFQPTDGLKIIETASMYRELALFTRIN